MNPFERLTRNTMKTTEEKAYQKDTLLIKIPVKSMTWFTIDITLFTRLVKGLILGENLVVK